MRYIVYSIMCAFLLFMSNLTLADGCRGDNCDGCANGGTRNVLPALPVIRIISVADNLSALD